MRKVSGFSIYVAVGAASVMLARAGMALTTTPSADGSALAAQIAGPGVQISNVSLTSNNTGDLTTQSSGFFSLGGNIGLPSGVILSTGSIKDAKGPNSVDNVGTIFEAPGDADLDALANGTSEDATILSFNFKTTTGKIFVQFVFASEEYSDFVDSEFNDVFGFFVDGKNIALVPGTTSPITINTINFGKSDQGVEPTGPGANAAFYIDNTNGNIDTEFDGLTTVLAVNAEGLDTEATHTMKLAIGDVGDGDLDSAVFLFSVTEEEPPPPPGGEVPEPASLGVLAMGAGALLLRKRR